VNILCVAVTTLSSIVIQIVFLSSRTSTIVGLLISLPHSFIRLLVHNKEHRDDIMIIWPVYGNIKKLDDVPKDIKKVILLDNDIPEIQAGQQGQSGSDGHFTITTFDMEAKTIKHQDGLVEKELEGTTIDDVIQNENRRATIQQFSNHVRLDLSGWTIIQKPYFKQERTVACGPILICAFYHEYFGKHIPMFPPPMPPGSQYKEDIRFSSVTLYRKLFEGLDDQSQFMLPEGADVEMEKNPWRMARLDSYQRQQQKVGEQQDPGDGDNDINHRGLQNQFVHPALTAGTIEEQQQMEQHQRQQQKVGEQQDPGDGDNYINHHLFRQLQAAEEQLSRRYEGAASNSRPCTNFLKEDVLDVGALIQGQQDVQVTLNLVADIVRDYNELLYQPATCALIYDILCDLQTVDVIGDAERNLFKGDPVVIALNVVAWLIYYPIMFIMMLLLMLGRVAGWITLIIGFTGALFSSIALTQDLTPDKTQEGQEDSDQEDSVAWIKASQTLGILTGILSAAKGERSTTCTDDRKSSPLKSFAVPGEKFQ
jgi:hypothetical protein